MGSPVSWVIRTSVKQGQLESFTTLIEEMVEATRAEPGTLVYEWFIDEAGENVHIYERYEDSAATMVHAGSFGANFAERFIACVDVTGFDIYGEPSDEVRNVFNEMGAAYFGTFRGFAR